MSKYVDVYLLPLPEKNIADYKKLARGVGRIFRKHGALSYREYVASDLKVDSEITPFPKAVKLKEGETLVYAAVEFKSEAHRNKVMKALCEDKDLDKLAPKEPLFEWKRMVYGGFSILVDI